MAEHGPIVIVEDDIDDQEIIEEVLKELKVDNKRIFFGLCEQALNYLKTTSDSPFIILCDINLPQLNGLDFKRMTDADPYLRQKSTPFIFFSTAATEPTVTEAFTKMAVQGFFQKKGSVEEIKKALTIIIEYWKLSKQPNS